MGERFNSAGVAGRNCPICYRVGSLAGERGTAAPVLKCGGCYATFRLDASRPFGQLERIPFHVADPAGYQAGARIADDFHCDTCGKRGVVGTCATCTNAPA